MDLRPFRVEMPQAASTTCGAASPGPAGRTRSRRRELVAYWASRCDSRAQERAMNRLPHFRADVDGFGIHLIHLRGRGPAPMPLLVTHGWPSSFVEMLELIPLLADPGAHGGDPADAFDVVVPSVPGFGFSDRPGRGMTRSRVAGLWAWLMEGLGYARFAAAVADLTPTHVLGEGFGELLDRFSFGPLAPAS